MAIQQSTTPATALTKAKYEAEFTEAMMIRRLYDQFSIGVDENGMVESGNFMGSSYYKHYLSDLPPSTTVISQTADITPKTLVDATSSISPTSRADAIQWAEAVELYSYTPWGSAAFKRVGSAAMETLELLAINAALQGDMVIKTQAARASFDHDTAGDLFTEASLFKAASIMPSLKAAPFMGNGRPQWLALFHSDLMYDLIENDNVVSVAKYQDKEILFNGEIGQTIHGFKLLADPQAKVFYGAGAAGDSPVATTLAAAVAALDIAATLTAGTNVVPNQWLVVGTAESGNTFYETNERIRAKSSYPAASTALTLLGPGANGGFRFAHDILTAVTNKDNVYPVLFGSPTSLVKMYHSDIGPFAKIVGPKVSGMADQFKSLAYKWHGGYGLAVPTAALRGEYACTLGANA